MPLTTTGNPKIDQATAEIAVVLRDAGYGRRDQDRYDEAMRLRDEIMSGAAELASASGCIHCGQLARRCPGGACIPLCRGAVHEAGGYHLCLTGSGTPGTRAELPELKP